MRPFIVQKFSRKDVRLIAVLFLFNTKLSTFVKKDLSTETKMKVQKALRIILSRCKQRVSSFKIQTNLFNFFRVKD